MVYKDIESSNWKKEYAAYIQEGKSFDIHYILSNFHTEHSIKLEHDIMDMRYAEAYL